MAAKLELDNVYVTITGLTKDQEYTLWSKLAFKVEVFGQEPRYRHLYSKRTKKTYAGLTNNVIEILNDYHIPYKLVDLRQKPESNENYSLVKEIDGKEVALRPYQQEIVDNCSERETIQAATGAGKAMPLDTPILTMDGFVPLSNIHVGSIVIDGLGKPTKVIGEFPQGKKEEWLITFSDGSTARCCEDHLWKYKRKDENNYTVDSLKNMLDENKTLSIPNCPLVEFKKNNLSIPPYELGKYLAEYSGDVRIPEEYLLAAEKYRFELLQGIVDGNKTDNKNDKFCLYTPCKQFAEDIKFLLMSLGHRAKVTLICNVLYSVETFTDTLDIVSIERTGNTTEMKCIAVDSDDHTFICNDFIVTHNTIIMAGLIAKYKVSPVCVFAAQISLCNQLKSEFEKFLGEEIGFIGDGIYDPKDITVMSLQSADEDLCAQAKMILIDECLPANAKVMMSDGTEERIGDIVKNRIKASVVTYNTTTQSLEDCKIINFMERPIGERSIYTLTIKTADKTLNLMCTNNHKIWVEEEQNYIRAENLKKDMHVVCYSNLDTVNGKIVAAAKTFSKIEYVYDITVEKNHNFFANNVLVSNCHHVPSDTCVVTASKCVNAYYRIGVSATPWRDDNSDMLIEAVLNKRKPENNITASKLIRLGYLVKPTIYFVPVKGVFASAGRGAGAYQQLYDKVIVDNNYRNKIICKIAYQLYKRNKNILLLVKYVRHGEFLLEKLNHLIGETKTTIKYKDKNGLENEDEVSNIEFLSGACSTSRRLAILEGIKQGACRLVISTSVFDEGIDAPQLDTLILAGGGKSSTRAYQRIGRVLRVCPGKTKAFVFDFDDETPMFRKQARIRRNLYEMEEEWDIKTFNVNV